MFRTKWLLAAAFVAALAPVALPQDTAGNPDDIAELLPADTILFAEMTQAPHLYKEWKEYVGAFCTPEGKKKVVELIESKVKEAWDKVPEKFQKDYDKLMTVVQRTAFAVTPPDARGGIPIVVVYTASDPALFKQIVEEDLTIFAADEKIHQGIKVVEIRKMADQKLDPPMFAAAAGRRMVIAMDWDLMCKTLDRAAGKGQGDDLRKSDMYRKLAAPTGDEPALRAFGRIPWDKLGGGFNFNPYSNNRQSAHEMDKIDALCGGLRRFQGYKLEATFRPGKISSTMSLVFDGPMPLLQAFTPPAGPKDILKFVPADSTVVAHGNLKGGKELWGEIEKMIKRWDAIEALERKARKADEEGPQDHDTLKKLSEEMQKELGFGPAELAAAVGNEVAFAMVGKDAFATMENTKDALLFVVKVTDAEKAKGLLGKLTAKGKAGNYEITKEGETTFYTPGEEGGDHPVFAVHGNACLIGIKEETLRTAIKTSAGDGFTKSLPDGAASTSAVYYVKHGAIWQLVQMFMAMAGRMAGPGAQIPDLSKDLDMNRAVTLMFSSEKDQWKLSSCDPGVGFALQIVYACLPAGVMFATPKMTMPGTEPAEVKPTPTLPEPPAMTPEKLAEKIKALLPNLRSDDLAARDDAAAGVRALGRQAIPQIAEAIKAEKDVEARSKLMKILMDWKAYDAFPEVLKNKVAAFVAEFQKQACPQDNNAWWGGFASWQSYQGEGFPYSMEPRIDGSLLKRLEHADITEIPAGVKQIAEEVREGKHDEKVLRQLAALLAFLDSSAAQKEVLSAWDAAKDPEAKAYLQIALGWSSDPKAREIVLKGLKDADRRTSRASFAAAEHSKDTALIPKLIELLKDADHETRWNASYTLRVLTHGAVSVNIYAPEEEFKAACAAAAQWKGLIK